MRRNLLNSSANYWRGIVIKRDTLETDEGKWGLMIVITALPVFDWCPTTGTCVLGGRSLEIFQHVNSSPVPILRLLLLLLLWAREDLIAFQFSVNSMQSATVASPYWFLHVPHLLFLFRDKWLLCPVFATAPLLFRSTSSLSIFSDSTGRRSIFTTSWCLEALPPLCWRRTMALRFLPRGRKKLFPQCDSWYWLEINYLTCRIINSSQRHSASV